jgi:hypothetical protein
MRKWAIWIPMLMIGSMLYWTLALSFGGLSLMTFATPPDPDVVDAAGTLGNDVYQPITVNLFGLPGSEASDPSDTPETGQAPASVTVDLVSDHESGHNDEQGQGDRGGDVRTDRDPGQTAF